MEDNNNSDSLYKLSIKKRNKELILDNEKKSDFPETREEQLKLIRKKYLEEEEQEQKYNINNMEEITNEQFIDSENKLNEIENQEQDQINNEYNYNNIEVKNNYEEENDIDIINDNISNNNNKISDENIDNKDDEKIDEIENKNIKKKQAPFKV